MKKNNDISQFPEWINQFLEWAKKIYSHEVYNDFKNKIKQYQSQDITENILWEVLNEAEAEQEFRAMKNIGAGDFGKIRFNSD